MSDHDTRQSGAGAGPAEPPHPRDDPCTIILGHKCGPTWLNGGWLTAIMRVPMPGVVIFVHGVNSDGEWYAQAEQGLCDGLNERLSVQGIGWRGMNGEEIKDSGGTGIFSQRVFAQGFKVGVQGRYHYWDNHYKHPARGSEAFWVLASPKVEYFISKGLDASRDSVVGSILTLTMAPFAIGVFKLIGMRINALPDDNWAIPLEAPDLPEPFEPQAVRFGKPDKQFDQTYEAPGQMRDVNRARDANEAYAGDCPLPHKDAEAQREATDAPLGDARSEASLRYEDHAKLRMQARREGLVKKTDEKVTGEDDLSTATAEYRTWREKKIKTYLAENVNQHATDHSTIMTNPEHARQALAYDVAIGLSHIRDQDMHQFRIAADWRFLKGLDKHDPHRIFEEYFLSGKFTKVSPYEWTRAKDSEGRMPDKILDQREHSPLSQHARERLNRGGHP